MREGIRASERRIYDTVRFLAEKSLGDRAPAVDVVVLAWTIVTTCHRVGTWYNRADRMSPDEVADNVCQMALHLLGQDVPVMDAAARAAARTILRIDRSRPKQRAGANPPRPANHSQPGPNR
jgi:hypothetical protein